MARVSLTAKDVMQTSLVTVRDDDEVWSVARKLVDNGISGAPVVDARGNLVGIISQTDLVRHLRDRSQAAGDFYADGDNGASARRRKVIASDLMTGQVIQASVDTPIDGLAQLMLRERIHRILIVRGAKLLGIVTTTDILKVL